jgi:hypothetical protein
VGARLKINLHPQQIVLTQPARKVERVAEYSGFGRILGMALSDEVADLERRCLELERQVEGMTDDPTVDYASLYWTADGVEIAYGIKDWDWGTDYPRISVAEALDWEIREVLKFPADAENGRSDLVALLSAFERHVAVLRAAIEQWDRDRSATHEQA